MKYTMNVFGTNIGVNSIGEPGRINAVFGNEECGLFSIPYDSEIDFRDYALLRARLTPFARNPLSRGVVEKKLSELSGGKFNLADIGDGRISLAGNFLEYSNEFGGVMEMLLDFLSEGKVVDSRA